ncbi:MAG: galactokinase [Solobacterium sp.]|nr:galactokinase [Solobacterium sp.]
MLAVNEIRKQLNEQILLSRLSRLYCCSESEAMQEAGRYSHVLDGLEKTFGTQKEAALFSAPGRTEIGGNHTDHQHGCVVAGSVNIDMIAAVAPNSLNRMRLMSEGYDMCEADLNDLDKKEEEEGTSSAILRGMCRAFKTRGASLSGLDLYVTSNVPGGSGVSSSAAFETLIGTILNELFMNEKADAVEIAKIGQWVENVYFGKPCGLMDQMACSVGGVIAIDFKDPSQPIVQKTELDLHKAGFALYIINSGAGHEDLTDEYAAVPAECCAAAKACGYTHLRDVPEEFFLERIPQIREECGDRAVLRALHFFHENRRAQEEAAAIRRHDYASFLQLVKESSDSSWEYLQNITPAGAAKHQEVALTIALAREALAGEGAVRVHGGGFAGTVQAFVPEEKAEHFEAYMEKILGKDACHRMAIRPEGGVRIL